MRQFQGSLGPIQDLEPSRTPGPAEPSKNGSPAASPNTSKRRARPFEELIVDVGVVALIACVLVAVIG